MPANLWELRSDVRPLEVAALRWDEVATLMARRGDEIVDAAVRATEGWDAAAAEGYDHHRRQVLANLDRFTTLATQICSSLQAVSSIITSAQKELDQAWTKVAMIPHEVVGESRYLVFKPEADEDRATVTSGQQEAEEIRRRLTLSLDQESTRLRSARAEFVMVRTELSTLAGGTFANGLEIGEEESGVGTVLPPSSTSVLGSAQGGAGGAGGAAGLPPIGPISFTMPHLTGISAAGLAPIVATAAGAAQGLRGSRRQAATATPPIGGMGGGAMAARAGTMSRGMASGRSGTQRLATPRLQGQAEDGETRAARDKDAARQAAKDAKRAALEEKRAERAARKAEREADKDKDRLTDPEVEEAEETDETDDPELLDDDDAPAAGREADDGGAGR